MAENIDFISARFATGAMMPVGLQEVDAIWMRKYMSSTARSIGEWATIVLATSATPVNGFFEVSFPGRFFDHMASIDIYQYRGGTNICEIPVVHQSAHDSSKAIGMYITYISTTIAFSYWPDHRNMSGAINFAGSQAQFGTFIYRLRGW